MYGYDSFGNMTRYNGWTPAYNANNQIAGWPYDAAGNMLTNGLAQMMWDAESRISAVTGASYLYDAQGNRVESSGSSVVNTVYFNGRSMARLVNGQWTDLIYGPTGLLAEVAGQENAEPQYRLLDHLGTQVGTADSSQLLKNPLDYNLFGQIRSGDTADPYFFTGKERDQESGLDYFGARYYASSMGRWMSPDWANKPEAVPYSDLMDPQSLNLYGYVRNNPLSKADPDGHCPQCVEQVLEYLSESPAGQQIEAGAAAGAAAVGAALGAAGGYISTHLSTVGDLLQGTGAATSVPMGLSYKLSAQGQIDAANAKQASADTTNTGPKAANSPGVTAGGQATDEHGNKVGPGSKPQLNNTKSNTREEANNKAKSQGSGSVEHKNPSKGNPHFHPVDAEGNKKPTSTHHEYPE